MGKKTLQMQVTGNKCNCFCVRPVDEIDALEKKTLSCLKRLFCCWNARPVED